jgi:hypothetical protein
VSDFTSSPDINISTNCSSSGSSSIDLTTVEGDFKALQWAMSITIAVEVLGALFFFATAWYELHSFRKTNVSLLSRFILLFIYFLNITGTSSRTKPKLTEQ